ncbi:hypothetical protein FRC11_009545, partial [Ceratobasidium sp. 423]
MSNRDSVNLRMKRELEKAEREIGQLTQALSQTPDDHPNKRILLARLGTSYGKRFDLRGEPEDIDKAIEYTMITLTMTPDNDPVLPSLLDKLREFHGDRLKRLNEVDDSDKELEYASLALSLTPDGHPQFPTRLGDLGAAHSIRYQRLGELGDLEKAIEHNTRAVELMPMGHTGLPHRLYMLGISHRDRFERLGDRHDIEKAIEVQSRAVALTPTGDPNLSNRLASLAVSHKNRFEHVGEIDDLEKAIECESCALALTPDGHPDLSSRLANLGGSHIHRFEHLGELGDLEKAIEYSSHALASTPDGHPHLSSQLNNLGLSHRNRFQRLGELGDLEKAIEYGSRALALTPDGHPDLSSRLMNLGVSHSIRFTRLGELGDLEKAIEYGSRALALTPDGHPHLSSRLMNLGVSHSNRCERLGELGDLEKAIEYGSHALALTPDDHPHLSSQLMHLGACLSNRFQHLGELADIEKAIEYQHRMLELTPNGHPGMSNRLHNLGASHACRFGKLHMQHDLDKVIECLTCALVLDPDGHPTLPDKHYILARHRFFKYHLTGEVSQLQDSLNSFRLATQSLAGSPRDRFRYASGWAHIASSNSALNPIEVYQIAIDLLPQFIWLGATTNQRYQDLEQVQNLAINAAAAAIAVSNFTLALEWLEHGRCVVWNQNLMLCSPLDQLHASHPTLATRLATVANQLHYAGSESRESQALSSGSLTPEQVGQKHRQLAKEYEDLLCQTHTLPGFEDFLQPIKADRLIQAARIGPIVVVNCHRSRCDALVILPQQVMIDHIPLPNFTGEQTEQIRVELARTVRARRLRERGSERRPFIEQGDDSARDFERVLKVLWCDIVKPVLEFLGCLNQVSVEDLPHITWCPTGALSFLPLHAAGDYDQPNSRIFDYVISSYTPTLTALLNSTSSSLTCDSRILAIGQANTPGQGSLPGTTREIECVKAHTRNKVEYTQLIDDQATTTAVLDAMEQHDWVHLACHAHQNVDDPTKSG